MAKFTVYFKRKKVGEYEFESGRIRVGRHPESEIFLPQQAVSRLHCSLEFKGGNWVVENSGGKNGLFVNGALVRAAKPLKAGNRIEFGNYIIHVDGGDDDPFAILTGATSASKPGAMADPPPIAPVPTGDEQFEGTFRMTREQVIEQRHEQASRIQAHLAWQAPDGQEVVVPLKDAITIGKGEEATVQIDGGMLTAAISARIEQKGNQHVIMPDSRWANVKVNGKKVRESHPLKDGDWIDISGTKFAYRGALF